MASWTESVLPHQWHPCTNCESKQRFLVNPIRHGILVTCYSAETDKSEQMWYYFINYQKSAASVLYEFHFISTRTRIFRCYLRDFECGYLWGAIFSTNYLNRNNGPHLVIGHVTAWVMGQSLSRWAASSIAAFRASIVLLVIADENLIASFALSRRVSESCWSTVGWIAALRPAS